MHAVAVFKVTERYLGSGCGLKLGRQAAWRPRSIGMVSSSWLAALCKRLLCLKEIARYLGSGYGLILGRQAAWRPRTIGMVSSGWLAALCKQSLFSDCEVWARVAGCRQTARCRPRHCLNVQTVCYAQEGTLNKFLVDGRVCCSCWSSGFHRWSVQMFTRAVLASADILQFFGRLVRREGVTAASAAVQKDGVHGPG